jgi:hypothetical protein
MSTVISLTGATGAFGGEVLAHLVHSPKNFRIRLLIRKEDKEPPFFKETLKEGKDRIEVIYGRLEDEDSLKELIQGADYVIHCAGIIPPKAEHYEKAAYDANFLGTKNLIDAVQESGRADSIRFVYIGTVAEYGNRNEKHLWGRVGDPLVSSDYDVYSYTKIKAERYLLDHPLPHFVSLRQTAIAHKYLFKNNMSDGLLYQTCFNAPYEWVTDQDSGLLVEHLVSYDLEGKLEGFWNQIYDIGGGRDCRATGFDSFDAGFKLMGKGVKDFMKPNWFSTRNFHGCWFYDSDVLENWLHFRTQTLSDFWKKMAKKYWYYKFGRIIPPSLLKARIFKPLLKVDDAPVYWVEHREDGKVKAFFGGYDAYEKIPTDWKDIPLLCEGKKTDGSEIDYDLIRTEAWAKDSGQLLSHGFDESKPKEEIDITDVKEAAAYRGGLCLSDTMTKGDLWTKLTFQCHEGHRFEAAPYTILFGGFWCPDCAEPKPWKSGKLAQVSQFHAQLYYADHDESEQNDVYPLEKEPEVK